jgi:hypothetical protein
MAAGAVRALTRRAPASGDRLPACGTSIADQLMPDPSWSRASSGCPPAKSCPPGSLRRGHDRTQVRIHGGGEGQHRVAVPPAPSCLRPA